MPVNQLINVVLADLVAAVQLGHGLLDESDPELPRVLTPGVHVLAVLLRQSVVNVHRLPVPVAPHANLHHASVPGTVQRLIVL